VGTTSVRTLETLYWLGVGLARGWVTAEKGDSILRLAQWDAAALAEEGHVLPAAEALVRILGGRC
jgi:S-adenosylmethionine:tRNA ribosyltransferase-isomerase